MEKRPEIVQTFIDSIPIFAGMMMYEMMNKILKRELDEKIECWFESMDDL